MCSYAEWEGLVRRVEEAVGEGAGGYVGGACFPREAGFARAASGLLWRPEAGQSADLVLDVRNAGRVDASDLLELERAGFESIEQPSAGRIVAPPASPRLIRPRPAN